jgi:hypothetical protein
VTPATLLGMACARTPLVGVTIALVLQSTVAAINVAPTLADIGRAMRLAQERPDQRQQFHSPYIVRLLDDPSVDAIDVVTEFRRYVLTAEKELSLGHWLFAQGTREAQAALQPWRGLLSMVARIRFHPHNTLTTVPAYDVTIGHPDLAAVDVVRTPIMAGPSGKRGDLSTPLTGATIEAVFDAAPVGQTVRPVMVMLAGQEVARVTIDFARLE